jgi:hypothetical protein
MEYALEGYGYCRSRVIREALMRASLPSHLQPQVDAVLDQAARFNDERHQRALLTGMLQWAGMSITEIHPPAELLAALHVRAPESPLAGLAHDVATAFKGVLDGLGKRHIAALLTHCSFATGADGAVELVLGAWSPSIMTDVSRGDAIAAGFIVALHGRPAGEGDAHLKVLARVFRKVCENGAVSHDHDAEAGVVDPQLLWARREDLPDEIDRRVTALLYTRALHAQAEQFRRSAAAQIDPHDRLAHMLLQRALRRDQQGNVWQRFLPGEHTRWGLANAVTAEAHWATSFEEALHLEQLGASLACMPSLGRPMRAPSTNIPPSHMQRRLEALVRPQVPREMIQKVPARKKVGAT